MRTSLLYLAMNLLLSSVASANAWMMRWSACLIWSTTPCDADFSNVLFTNRAMEPSFKHKLNERSRMDLNAFDLWGMAALGKIFSLGGRLPFISSQRTMQAGANATFSFVLVAKCASALGLVADWCCPLLIAMVIWAPVLVHCFLEISGQPSWDHSARSG